MLSDMFNRVIFALVLQMCIVSCTSKNSTVSNKSNGIRQKRTLNFYFPYNSCYAVSNDQSLHSSEYMILLEFIENVDVCWGRHLVVFYVKELIQ